MNFRELWMEAKRVFQSQPRLIRVDGVERVVFVGDTHGEYDATNKVIQKYFDKQTALIFVGDYVDRGPQSLANIEALLRLKLEHPDRIVLLQGNHENWKEHPIMPASFWESLDNETLDLFAGVLAELPWSAVTPNGIMAVHGALPPVDSLEEIDDISYGSNEWRHMTWGDYQDLPGQFLSDVGSRPQFGRDRFETLMERFGQRVLIRGHQPPAPLYLFDDRCLTIITAETKYARERNVVIAGIDEKIENARDLTLESV
jgi:predicted phosphodiesterase